MSTFNAFKTLNYHPYNIIVNRGLKCTVLVRCVSLTVRSCLSIQILFDIPLMLWFLHTKNIFEYQLFFSLREIEDNLKIE